jgi:hypothetical protein
MRKHFSFWPLNSAGAIVRFAALVLLGANLIALYFIFRPIGGSPSELRAQVADLQTQLRQRRGALERTRTLVAKIEKGREEGNDFMEEYFLPRRAAYSTVLSELMQSAAQAKIRPKESAYASEPVEGSDTLSMMQISANYEGAYADLIRFINLIDKSDNLLIIESLNATPQQGSDVLNVTVKLDTFVREDGSPQAGSTQAGSTP